EIRLIDEDIRGLQDRIAEKTVCAQISLLYLFLFFLISRIPLQPGDRNDHGEQQMQNCMLRNPRLHEYRGSLRIDASRKPIDQQLADELSDAAGIGIVRRECVPVRDKEIALELVLKAFPILQGAEIVAEMEQSARLHAAEDSFPRGGHGVFPAPNPTAVERIVLNRLWVKVPVMVWI